MQDFLILGAAMLATGCVAGVLAGLFGIGGGVVIVPVLEAALGFLGVDPSIRMHVAVATSLATIIPTSVSSARAHHKRGAVDLDIVRRWAPYVLLGAVAGAWIASQVGSRVLAAVFATLAMANAVKMVLFPGTRAVTAGVPAVAWVLVIPTVIGCASTMMGIGGGIFMVMALTLFNEPIYRAVGTSALFGLVIAVPGTLGFVWSGWDVAGVPPFSLGYVSLVGFALIAPTTVLLAPLGARIAHGFSENRLRVVFGLFLAVAALRLFSRAFA